MMIWTDDRKNWPIGSNGKVLDCWNISGARNVTFTSSGAGILDGNGPAWWGYLSYFYSVPKMLNVYNSTGILLEYWHFRRSPRWTTDFKDIADLTIRYSTIDNRRNE
jgi:polygalacturonase